MRHRIGQPPKDSSSGRFGQYFNNLGGDEINLGDYWIPYILFYVVV